jgi:hypothetical protein
MQKVPQVKGIMQLFEDEKLIREYKFKNQKDRKRIWEIWESEIKPMTKKECYELIIKND